MAISVAGALAACGGASKSNVLSEGDEICRTSNAPVQSLKKPTNYPELGEAAKVLVTASDTQTLKLRELGVPGGDKDDVDAMVSAIAGVSASARRVQETAGRTDDKGTSEAVNQAAARAKDAAGRARAYGFTACGVNSEAGVTTVFDGAKGIVKAAFVAKAEGACKAALTKQDKIKEPRRESAFPAYFDAIVKVEDEVVVEMRGLAVPPGDEAAVSELIDARAKLNDKAREFIGAMRSNDERRAVALTDEMDVLFTAAAAKADAYGIRECGTASMIS